METTNEFTTAGAASEFNALKALMAELLEQLGARDKGDGNAPGHCHCIPGVWDSDNGKLAGKPCAWCAVWNKAKATGLVHNVELTGGEAVRVEGTVRTED